MGGAIGGAPHLHLTTIRMTRPRLFIAGWPPEQVASQLAHLVGAAETGVRWVPAHDLHVTLRFLGSADEDAVSEGLVATDLPVAQARLGPAVTLFSSEVVMVPVAGLDELVLAVSAATADCGSPPDPRPFVGHLTLGRLRRGARSGLIGVPVSALFAVDEVSLVSSTLTQSGPNYRILRRFPCRG